VPAIDRLEGKINAVSFGHIQRFFFLLPQNKLPKSCPYQLDKKKIEFLLRSNKATSNNALCLNHKQLLTGNDKLFRTVI